MADLKISQLPSYSALQDADVFPVVDTANTTTKKTSWSNIKLVLGSTFLVLGGTAGGQTANGGTAANESLRLKGTAHATKATSYLTLQEDGGLAGIGLTTPASLLNLGGTLSLPQWTTRGAALATEAGTYTDTTSNSGTITTRAQNSFGIPTWAKSQAGALTITNGATVYIAGAPVNGTNTTVTNPLALYIGAGNSSFGGRVGIGTTAPATALEVDTTVTPNTTVVGQYIVNVSTGNLCGTAIRLGYAANTASSAGISGYFNNTGIGGAFLGLLVGSNEYVTINQAGAVGFGTTVPLGTIHVDRKSTALMGNATNTAGGTTVTGSGTQFTNAFAVGDTITISGETQTITAVTSDTSLTTTTWTNAHTTLAYTTTARTGLVAQQNGKVGIGTTTPSATLTVVNSIAAQKALIVQAAASQTANLQEWQDSSSVMRTSIDKVGNLIFSDSFVEGFYWGSTTRAGVTFTGSTEGLAMTAYSSIYPVLTVKGASGQSVPLQQWSLNGAITDVVDNVGKLGLNTTSPTAFLDINSNILRLRTAKTPSSAADTGNAGDICWDSSFIYTCVATNTWKRVAIATW